MLQNKLENILTHITNLLTTIENSHLIKILILLAVSMILFFFFGFSFYPIVLLAILAFAYKKPVYTLYLLAAFIPFKAFFRSVNLFDSRFITLVIPILLIGAVSVSIKNWKKLTDIDLLLFLIFFASFFSCLGFVIIYGFRIEILLDFLIWLQLLGFYLLGKLVLNEDFVERFVNFNLIIANIVSIISIVVYFLSSNGSKWIESYELISNRASGPLANPNALAGYLLLSIIIGFFTNCKDKKKLLLLLIPFMAFFMTFARGALLVFLGLVFIYLLQLKKWKVIIAFALTVLLGFIVAPKSVQKRMTNIFSPEHISFSSDSGRIWSLENVLYIERNHFLFGTGFGSYGGEYAYSKASPTYLEGRQGGVVGVGNTDNQWLQIFAQQGIVGLTLYSLLVIYLLTRYSQKNLLFYLTIGYFILAIFIDVFQFYQISFLAWLFIGKETIREKV